MNNGQEKWDGETERRKYCAAHCHVSKAATNSVPRWAFISAMSTMILIALSFGGWHVTSLKALSLELQARAAETENHINNRVNDLREEYGKDVQRFYNAVDSNREMLIQVSKELSAAQVTQGKIVAKQDLVLEKIKLTE